MGSPTSSKRQFRSARDTSRLRYAMLAVSALLAACGSAGYTVDSATSSCRQNPVYCAHVTGEESIAPTVREATQETVVSTVEGGTIKGGADVASVAAILHVLTPTLESSIEEALVQCVEWRQPVCLPVLRQVA